MIVLCLGHLHEIHSYVYIKTGLKNRSRIISLEKVKEKIESSLGELGYISEAFCEALIGLHAFTGCDTVSSFAGKGKTKPLKIKKSQRKYVSTFKELGESWNLEKGLLQNIEEFVCAMYGDHLKNVNDLRYKIYCSELGKISCEDLPPCKLALIEHYKRVNCQSKILRLALEQVPEVSSLIGCGWEMLPDEPNSDSLDIKWMSCKFGFHNFFQEQLFILFKRPFKPCIYHVILTTFKINHFRTKTRLF